jgi:hypothetical protein
MGFLQYGRFDLDGRICVSDACAEDVLLLTYLSFGYDTGQISGFLAMPDFLKRFGQFKSQTGKFYFSNVRAGLIVAMVSCSDTTEDLY